LWDYSKFQTSKPGEVTKYWLR